jgi:hypothetical protein
MPPLHLPSAGDRLLDALDDRQRAAAQRAAAASYDFTMPADRWTRLVDVVWGVALMALWPLTVALLIPDLLGSNDRVLPEENAVAAALVAGLTGIVLVGGLVSPSLEGPRPASTLGLWIWLGSGAGAVLLGIGVLPREWTLALPAVVVAVAVVPAVRGLRGFRATDTSVPLSAPPGAEPVVLAAALRDQRRASHARLAAGLGLDADFVQLWLTAMLAEGLVESHARLVYGPRAYSLTRRGRTWLEAFQARGV